MICRSPPVYTLHSQFKGAVDVPYGFRMDNVKDVYNLTRFDETNFGAFTIFPDPEFEEFKGKTKAHQKKTEFLTIDVGYLFLLPFKGAVLNISDDGR